ncbi:MAG: ROK family transcriptional regulator [Pirellulaceae bacterium]|nr:ROK family transcriptional regulator [Pirellulaceae bacterium]
MTVRSARQPRLLRQLNERSVLRVLQAEGPCSRAEVTRQMGVTPPTVSKAVAALLRSGLLEEFDAPENGRGRPAKLLRLANQSAQVLGLVIDAAECQLIAAGLDGELKRSTRIRFATPASYEQLVEDVAEHVRRLAGRSDRKSPSGLKTLGLGISMPGLIDHRHQRGLLSPNVPLTNGQSPAADLGQRLGLETVLVQETHALCMAERYYGQARGLDDFAMLDATTGVGLSVFSHGRLLTGHRGLAGEIGHVPVQAAGAVCGCGRVGCLETVASDTAFVRDVSRRLGRAVGLDEILQLASSGQLQPARQLQRACRWLARAVAMVINLLNPATVFVHSRLFELDPGLLGLLIAETERLAMRPSFLDCQVRIARASKLEGAVAGIIQHLTDSRVPAARPLAGIANHQGHFPAGDWNVEREVSETDA